MIFSKQNISVKRNSFKVVKRNKPTSLFNNYTCEINSREVLGVDINIGKNLFALSDGYTIPYESKFIGQAIRYAEYIQNKSNSSNKSSIEIPQKNFPNKKKMITLRTEKIYGRIKGHSERKARELVLYAKENGYKHLVLENLNQDFDNQEKSVPILSNIKAHTIRRTVSPNEVAKLLNLSELKNMVKRIANKYEMMVSFVDPHFTSKTCPKCGCISKDNRNKNNIHKFKCVNCGYEDNADKNAAVNIKERIINPNLRKYFERYDEKEKMFKEIPICELKTYRKIYKQEKGMNK